MVQTFAYIGSGSICFLRCRLAGAFLTGFGGRGGDAGVSSSVSNSVGGGGNSQAVSSTSALLLDGDVKGCNSEAGTVR